MPVTYRGGTTSTTTIATVPAQAQPGDLLLLFSIQTTVVSTPAGWTRIRDDITPSNNGSTRGAVFQRTATASGDGSASSTFTVESGGSGTFGHVVAAFGGVHTAGVKATGATLQAVGSQNVPGPALSYTRRAFVAHLAAFSGGGGDQSTSIDTDSGALLRVASGTPVVFGTDSERFAPSPGRTATNTGGSTTALHYAIALDSNTGPGAPGAFASPTAGQVVNESATVQWGAATDPDNDALTYGLDLTADNGATWQRVYTGQSTTVTLDTSQVPATTTARFRVYAHDGQLQGPTTESATFSVVHNVSPTAPDQLAPNGVTLDRTVTQRFRYRFNDPNGAGDSQSKRELRYRLVGAAAWTVVTDTTTSTFRDFAPSFFAAGDYEWQVRTYDSGGLVSPWSASAFFTAATPPPGPTILSPANGATIGTSSGLLAWSYPTQQAFQVRKIGDNAGAPDETVLLFNTGVVVSATARDQALTYPVNGRTEHLQVRVQDSGTGLWSTYSSIRVPVSYTPPATPSVTVDPDDATASIRISVLHPTPTGTQPAVEGIDVHRRESTVGGDGIRIAASVAGDYVDRTPASGVDYEYLVVALGASATSTASEWQALGAGAYEQSTYDFALYG